MVEVEIRTCMESTEECINKIEQSGFKKEKVINQHDIMIDTPDAQLFREGNKIRIRIEDDKAELTYKGNINNYKDLYHENCNNVPLHN